jgi:hypothetical protein
VVAQASPGVDVLAAATADHQGLAPSFGHEVHPVGFVPASWPVEVGELADVVDLKVRPGFADLAASGDEPVDQLVSLRAGHDRPSVGEDGLALSCERCPAEAGDQWFPSPVAWDGDGQSRSRSLGCLDGALVLRAIFVTVDRCFPASAPARRSTLRREASGRTPLAGEAAVHQGSGPYRYGNEKRHAR